MNYTFPKLDFVWMLLNCTQNLSYIEDARNAMNNALIEWQTSFNITFVETTELEKADIKLSFLSGKHGDYYDFDGPGGILAHAYYPHESTHRGVIHMDADEFWDYDFLYCVILHELGHTFGLGHSSVKEAVMAPFYHGASKLHEDDRNGIGDLYGLKSKFGPITPYNTTTTTRSTTRSTFRGVMTTRNSTYKQRYRIYRDGKTINIYNSHVQITR